MATVTKPIALDESINTTEQTPRNIADVLAEELKGIADNILPPNASQIAYDNTASGLIATNVQNAIDETETIRLNTSVSGITLYRVGKIVTLTIASLSSEIGISGLTIPYGFRPIIRVSFVGHAFVNNQDIWSQGFRLETTGELTARSANANNAIAVTWAVASTSYITTDD